MRNFKYFPFILPALVLFVLGFAGHAQIVLPNGSTINTIAGNGTSGYSGDGGQATSAEFHNPWGVAVDSSGNVYIADAVNNVIRKITKSTGVITTVAGTGAVGSSGDGGPATSAKLNNPTAVALDSTGILYIADTYNSRVRKVDLTGTISTYAGIGVAGASGDGDLAGNAKLNLPMGVAVDSSGNVYIADYENNYVRVVSSSTLRISAYAGYAYTSTVDNPGGFFGDGGLATSAELFAPVGLALDSSGNLYIADSGNERIRKVTASTQKISTVAGNGTGGYSGDGGLATGAELNDPEGVAVDAAGNLYIADSGNYRIRRVLNSTAHNGYIYTVAGNGTGGFSGDGGTATSAEFGKTGYAGVSGIAVDSSQNFYIADIENQRIRAVGGFTNVNVLCSPNPTTVGSGTTCTENVYGASPTGTVTWKLSNTVLQVDTLSGTYDRYSGLTTEAAGSYTIRAVYSGDSNNAPGSASTTLTIH